ncbi:hypothetical protein BD289DRAFT_106785 [Coniella lustricola]|uniref:HECT-type E3 ubiquitin transferase n=1 Tax=Coniella lustricola TaxID=2025994 RepID=A0A2T3AGE5_9PEZI|nr:hypothetical protein BD289DRAFT_106785 [Coniella lustricola]
MGKILKSIQPKHCETRSLWVHDFVQTASCEPLPLLPQKLHSFPIAKWPLPRGDLYHWIRLLNKFDNILECCNKVYKLDEGPQTRPFGCDLLLGRQVRVEDYGTEEWDEEKLKALGYREDGDSQLVTTILEFTQRLLSHCGNRSIYASSPHLNNLLNSTDLSVVHATLEVGLELAARYQASVKRMSSPNRQLSHALLANHYNIDLDRVQQIAQPFVKTPIISLSDATVHAISSTTGKHKEREKVLPAASSITATSLLANDLGAIISTDQASEGLWKGWGDVKVVYYPQNEDNNSLVPASLDRTSNSSPGTPTPLRRSSTMGAHQSTPRGSRTAQSADEGSSSAYRTPNVNEDNSSSSSQRSLEIPQSVVASAPIHDLLKRVPEDMPKTAHYEALNRFRICKALMSGPGARQQALAVRLLAIANLAHIHPESVFLEQVLKQDNDEPRRYHLVYQLVELIHPSTAGQSAAPRWLQTIVFTLLENISQYGAKCQDVISALNATVNHGVLLYVIRKAVVEMKEHVEQSEQESVELHDWRYKLFKLAMSLALTGRIGNELMSAGLVDVLVDIVNMRTEVANCWHHDAVQNLDQLITSYGSTAFQAFNNANGLANAAQLMIHTTATAKGLAESGQGTKHDFYSTVVDYEIPFYQQQTLKWLLKLIHHIMNPSGFPHGGVAERLLRNLVDNSKLLDSLRTIMENTRVFGAVVWTNSISLLTDFINNDPTSFAAISETGMIKSLLESLTGRSLPSETVSERPESEDPNANGAPADDAIVLEPDVRPHPPEEDTLATPRSGPLASGILPSPEAIGAILPVINAICLNQTGMKLVVSSRVLESILEIFESENHVRLMYIDQDLAYNIGLQIDELARHHPALRQTIANSVIDMIARVQYLGKTKAASDGWGAKLVHGSDLAKEELSAKAPQSMSGNGKETAASSEDVEMTDVAMPEDPLRPSGSLHDVPKGMTPYIFAVAQFLQTYVTNAPLRSYLTRSGGIGYLLDLIELPSLPHDFVKSLSSKILEQVLGAVVESAPVLGLPAILNRLQDSLQALEPLVSTNTSSEPFFRSSVEFRPLSEQFSAAQIEAHSTYIARGTALIKALLRAQSLLRTLNECFPPVTPGRPASSIAAVNVYDHLLKVVQTLGPVFRAVLLEEMALVASVPQEWTSRSENARLDNSENPHDTYEALLPELLGQVNIATKSTQADAKQTSVHGQNTPQFQNYQVIRTLLHSFKPRVWAFLHTLGKALMPRRERDIYVRSKHMQVADALAEFPLGRLQPIVAGPVTVTDLTYWTVFLHVIHNMLIDPNRRDDRAGPHIILPVLDAFKKRQGIDTVNQIIKLFADELVKDNADVSATKVASVGLQKALDLYSLILNGKYITESVHQLSVASRSSSSRQPEYYQTTSQFIVETRMSVLPAVSDLWRSPLIERASTDVAIKVVGILKVICQGEQESSAPRRDDSPTSVPALFKRETVKFPWAAHAAVLSRLIEEQPEELAQEAVYRAIGTLDQATDYCRLHQKGVAGPRNPIPPEDAYEVSSPARPDREEGRFNGFGSFPEAMLDESNRDSHDSMDEDSHADRTESASSSAAAATTPPATVSISQDRINEVVTPVFRDDLDAERDTLRYDLVDQCLDVIRAHPRSVFEVSELLHVAMGIDRPDSEDARQEMGETLANALMSFALDDDEKRNNGSNIAAYAHLLSLMLHGSEKFFNTTVKILKDNVSDYLGFLKVPPSKSTDELPPWIPHILLIFEMLLAEDAQPLEVRWTPPRSEDEEIHSPVLQAREPIISEEAKMIVLESALNLLPRIGKNEDLAVAVLRVIVMLTRTRAIARIVGDKMNLQSLFMMVRQLAGIGSARLKETTITGNIMTILRHIIEDEETLRQIMRSEIRKFCEQSPRGSRAIDVPTYTRQLAHFALRSPELFIEVTNDMVKLTRFVPSGEQVGPNARGVTLTLKDKSPLPTMRSAVPAVSGSESVEPAVQTLTEELTINDVKPTTEAVDKDMTDASKPAQAESKRPVVENPDGVVHYLLCELLTWKEVADKDSPSPLSLSAEAAKETESSAGDATPSTPTGESPPLGAQGQAGSQEEKEKKTLKTLFKTDEHPIFIYRCFLLNCLAELLQSYTRTKMEFINFKRSAPLFANTPVKPRAGVLNYLLQDLLCMSSLTSPLDSIAAKKKAATSEQARQVLVALVAKTNEKPVDRTRDRFDYDDDPDLLFVRKWVLDMILRTYKEASTPHEPFDVRYAKLLSLAELMLSMIGEKDRDSNSPRTSSDPSAQLKRLMFEKGFLPALTASVADIDLTFPGVKRTIKYILRVLQVMTSTAILLSQANLLPSGPQDSVEDEIASVSSLSDIDEDREDTPDLYRNSALGMLERGREDDYEDDSEEDEDEEMDYEDEFPDELDYGDEMSQDGEEDVSDEDEELGEMGEIEGLPGHPVGVEVIMEDDDDEDHDDEDMDEDSEDDDSEDDDDGPSEDIDGDLEDRIEIVDEDGNPIDDDGAPGWEDETSDDEDVDGEDDEEDYGDGVQDLDELADMPAQLHGLHDLIEGAGDLNGHHHHHHHILADDGFGFGVERFDDDVEEDDEDEEEEDDDVDGDDAYIYDYTHHGDDIQPPVMPSGLGWDALVVDRGPPRRHRPFPVGPFVVGPHVADPLSGMSSREMQLELVRRDARNFEQEMGAVLSSLIRNRHADPATDFRSFFRSGRPSGPPANAEDGLNPLLRRGSNNGRDLPARPSAPILAGRGHMPNRFFDGPMHILSDIMASLPPGITPPRGFSLHITQNPGARGETFEIASTSRVPHSHHPRSETRRDVYQEPHQAVAFAPVSTEQRWLEEARIVFAHTYTDKASRLNMYIWAKLTPQAAEHEKKRKAEDLERQRKEEEERRKSQEEERQAREAKEAEERAAREKAEAEERERREAEAEAAEAAAQAEATGGEAIGASADTEPQAMEGIEVSNNPPPVQEGEASAPQPRIFTTIRGEQVDITDLGIDADYMEALPDEMREEVIAQTITSRRTEAREAAALSGNPTVEQGEEYQEFLDALPEHLRIEVVQSERQERRRIEREAARRAAAATGQAAAAQDMDTASILASLNPELRQQVLLDHGNEIMDQLPPDMAAEARALNERVRSAYPPRPHDSSRHLAESAAISDTKPQRRTVVQMLDKSGVATLLRFMFVGQQGSLRSHLFRVLSDICENRQNRLEVIGSLLQILQFGSTDMEAVERSFSALSLKAKQPRDKDAKDAKDAKDTKDAKDSKTPQGLKRTLTNVGTSLSIQQSSEISPLLVVQQCLDLLVELSGRNPHVPSLFLTENDLSLVSLKQGHNRKGKSKDSKAHKYAINSLLHLLDRDVVMESSTVMQLLVDLLNKVTLPLQALERRRKEAEEEAQKAIAQAKLEAEKAQEQTSEEGPRDGDAGATLIASDAAAAAAVTATAEPSGVASEKKDEQTNEQKKVRQLQPPLIPPENLRLVIKIFVAQECSSKTFQNTISTIKNLSNIPEAKQVFGKELVKQAQVLSKNIVDDLDELLPHIEKAESGTEIQGLALSKFSPGASEQNKLLRVLMALYHLFEIKKNGNRDANETAAADEWSALLMTLYHNETFNEMWDKLSACLSAIHQRDNMSNVATILLPLIESLMVVCKNTTVEHAPQASTNKDIVLSSPEPDETMAGLFFKFTDAHRRVLNDLVRQNNKLMSGTFSVLVWNPKVLDFDNKRSYFTRVIHAKHNGQSRPSYPGLTINAQRKTVFHDSFRALAFKSDDEVKYGKLNVRFNGEEGVDAGGLTREWFQVLTRAMFDPNYVLFTPVSSDRTTFHPNTSSSINDEHLNFFKFIGRIIGKAVYEGRLLDCYFSRAVYKRILGKQVSVKDMESFDPDFYRTLSWMLENDITGTVYETFSVEEDVFGAKVTVDLIENGRNIDVTNENKHEYVRLIVEHKLLSSVKEQMDHFLKGFHGIIPENHISIFNEQELELLISGLPDIDVDDWKSNAEYTNYTAASQQIQWFWRAVRAFDKEERAKLLQFVTGTSKVPLNGFKELEGMNGIQRFNIHRDYGSKDRLPSSHTCFNQLDLPEYESYDALRNQLLKAITTGSDYFGFA